MTIDAMIWQQKKDVSNLYLAYHDGGSRAWKLVPWHGQELLTLSRLVYTQQVNKNPKSS